MDKGVIVQPQRLINPAEVFAKVYAPTAVNELIGDPVAGGFAESAHLSIIGTVIVGIEIGDSVDAITNVLSARPKVRIDCLVFHGPALELSLALECPFVELLGYLEWAPF